MRRALLFLFVVINEKLTNPITYWYKCTKKFEAPIYAQGKISKST